MTAKIVFLNLWFSSNGVQCEMAKRHNKLKIIDLFSGAGGFGLGATRAGFNLAGAVEIDPPAISVHKKNFPKSPLLEGDISALSGAEILQTFNLKTREIDGIIGGPPCQGFSHMGHGNACDPRNQLFIHFFEIVNDASPKFFLAENVPGILSPKNSQLIERALAKVNKYEILGPIRLVAKDFGVPTTRARVFYFGYLKDQMNSVKAVDFVPKDTKPVYVQDALKGLPQKIDPLWLREEDGWQKIDKTVEGTFGSKLYKRIPNKVGDKEAIKRLKENNQISGCLGTRHSQDLIDRYSKIDQGEVDRISKSRRLVPNGFCPTLRAGTGSDKGSYQAVRPLHPTEDRVITPREAARLQGFPDWFQFHSTKWHSFRQIGNSVSPILAEHILRVINKAF